MVAPVSRQRDPFELLHFQQDRRRFKAALATIAREFRGACRIGSDAFWRSLVAKDEYTGLLLHRNDRRRVDGFLLFTEGYHCRRGGRCGRTANYPAWYVNLVCASGAGSGAGVALLEQFEALARARGVKYLTMHALPYVIGYYRRFGYKFSQDGCSEPAALRDAYERAARKFSNDGEPFRDRKFAAFMRQALAKGLGHDGKKCGTGLSCARDGLYLSKCIARRR